MNRSDEHGEGVGMWGILDFNRDRILAVLIVILSLLVIVSPAIGTDAVSEDDYWTYTLNYDGSKMTVSGGDPLSYGDGMDGMGPIANSVHGFQEPTDLGSWAYGVGNKLVDSTFYATFTPEGEIYKILDPDDLYRYEDGTDATADIQTMDVLWCIPTIYWSSTSTSLTISNDPSKGEPYAHTVDGHVYDYLGYAVYEGTVLDGKLRSVSQHDPTTNLTIAEFIDAANATFADSANGVSMVWNWYQYSLLSYIAYFSIEGFDVQTGIGYGCTEGSKPFKTGYTNEWGPIAGNTRVMTSNVKFFIENPWGSILEFVGGFTIDSSGNVRISQSSDGSTDGLDPVFTMEENVSGNAVSILTSAALWGMASDAGAYSYSGYGKHDLSVLQPTHDGADAVLTVGGAYSNSDEAGIGYQTTGMSVSTGRMDIGSRLAYVFDIPRTVTFRDGYDTSVVYSTQVVSTGDRILAPSSPSKVDYLFKGWYTQPDGGVKWDYSTPVDADMSLYARWEVIELIFETEPTAELTVTKVEGYPGAVVFDATDSSGYTRLLWDFGDGTSSEDPCVTHFYNNPGTYTATLTVSNDNGSNSVTYTIEVPSAEPEEDTGWTLIFALAVAATIAGALILRKQL